MKAKLIALLGVMALVAACAKAPEPTTPKPIEIKVVAVSMFEIGEDQGDTAGEFQLWKERQKATERLPFAHHHDLYLNKDTGVLLLLTGMGSINSASAVMQLGMDPRFDLSKAYWVIAGIAGVDPENASIGSAAWAEWLVDGDLSYEIDPREMPKDWPTGYLPLDSTRPYDPKRPPSHGEVFQLNPKLVNWAYERTKDIALPDNADLQKERARYKDYPNAQKPPFVLKGDNIASMTFWHGKILNEWAEKWVDYWTEGKGEFVTSAMEDTGSFTSLNYLAPTGKVDKNRVLVLRTASNYTMQPPGQSAAEHLLQENAGYAGLSASVEAAYTVGSAVVNEIATHWDQYRDTIPGSNASP